MSDNVAEFSKLDVKTQDLLLQLGKRLQVAKNIEKILSDQLEDLEENKGDKVVVKLKKLTFLPPVDKLGIPLNREVNVTIRLTPLQQDLPKYKYVYNYTLKNKVPITIVYEQDIIISYTTLKVSIPNDKSDPENITITSFPTTLSSGHIAINLIASNNLAAWKASLYEKT